MLHLIHKKHFEVGSQQLPFCTGPAAPHPPLEIVVVGGHAHAARAVQRGAADVCGRDTGGGGDGDGARETVGEDVAKE